MYFLEQVKGQLYFSFFTSFEWSGKSREVTEKWEEASEKNWEKDTNLKDKASQLAAKAKDIENGIWATLKIWQQALDKKWWNFKAVKTFENTWIETLTEIPQIAGVENVDTIFSEINSSQPDLVISENIQNQVAESLIDNPIDNIEEMSKADIESEVMRRAIALKVEEQNTRLLTPVSKDNPWETEADFIAWLEAEFKLDANSLAALRAENQGWIGSSIDTTWEISNPEVYKQEMQTLAENAQKAQEYAARNKDLLEAWNQTILANVAAILDGQNIEGLTPEQTQTYKVSAMKIQSSWDGFSSLWRLMWSASGWFNRMWSGVWTINTNPSQLRSLPPTSVEKAQDLSALFGSAIEKYDTTGEFAGWNNKPALHQVVMKESWGIIGRLNYTFQAVADQMGTKINDPQFVTYIHNQLKSGAKASDFWIRSTASWIGQFIRANVLEYYPDGFEWIGDADQESIWMLRYIKERYWTPENTVAQYGKHHEWY